MENLLLAGVLWAVLGRCVWREYTRSIVELHNGWEVVFVAVCGPWVWLVWAYVIVRHVIRRKRHRV